MAAPISTTYTPDERMDVIKQICGLIIQSSVETACKQVGIAESTFYAWVASDELLAEEYMRARVAIAYKDEIGIEKLVEQASRGEIDPAAARVAIDGRKWLAGKRNPKVYGDKLDMTSNGKEIKGTTIVVANQEQKDLLEKI
jgi:hypothetical protein